MMPLTTTFYINRLIFVSGASLKQYQPSSHQHQNVLRELMIRTNQNCLVSFLKRCTSLNSARWIETSILVIANFGFVALMHMAPVRATPLKLMCSYIYEGKAYKEIYIVDSEQLLVEISYPFAPSQEERNIIESLIVESTSPVIVVARLQTGNSHYFKYEINKVKLEIKTFSVSLVAGVQPMTTRTCKRIKDFPSHQSKI